MCASILLTKDGGKTYLGDAFHGLLPFEQDEIDQAYLEYLKHGLPESDAKPKRVLIVGAGMAGIVSAMMLKKAGHDITIVEANTRVGGRIKTFRNSPEKRYFEDPKLTAEAGAMRIPDDHKLVQYLIDKSAVPTQLFLNRSISRKDAMSKDVMEPERGPRPTVPAATGNNFIHANYRHATRRAFDEEGADVNKLLNYQLSADENRGANKFLERYIAPLRERVRANPKKAWPELIEQYGEYSTRRFLIESDPRPSENAIEMIGVLDNLASRMSYSFIQSFIELAIIQPDTPFWLIKGGTDKLPQALFDEHGLDDDTFFNQMMVALYLQDGTGNVRIQTDVPKHIPETDVRDHQVQEMLSRREWDEVIVTIPFSSFRLVRVWPAFTQEKRKAIRDLHYDAATKVLLEFRERFWETQLDIHGGGSITDLPNRFMYYPSERMGSSKGGVMLVSYSWADDARRWDSMPHYTRFCYALDNVAITHAQHDPDEQDYEVRERAQQRIKDLCVFDPKRYEHDRENIVGAATVSWMNNPYAFGEAAIFYPGQLDLLHEAITRSEWGGKARIAGEHASLKHAWIEGAIESAMHASLLVNENELPTLSPPGRNG